MKDLENKETANSVYFNFSLMNSLNVFARHDINDTDEDNKDSKSIVCIYYLLLFY